MEQAHLAAEAAVVALLRLLQHMEIGVELLLVRPAGAVDALQLRVLRIAAPIGAGQLRQLEGLAELARRGQMRARAHVEPVALAVDGDLLVLRDLADPFGLEALAMLAEIIGDPVAAPDLAGDLLVAVDDLAHALLDGGEIVRREGRVAGEVVIEAVLDRRAEGDLGAGIELLHRLGQHMGAVVAQQLEGVGMGARDDLDPGVLLDGRRRDPSSVPSILMASAALARPGPMAAASSAPDSGRSNWRRLPSGSVIEIMAWDAGT